MGMEVATAISGAGRAAGLASGTAMDCRSASMSALSNRHEEEYDMASGSVKWFDATKGFGFLQPEDGARTYSSTSPPFRQWARKG